MPKRLFTTHRSIGLSLAVILVFFLGYFIFGATATKTVMDSLVIGTAVTICWSWRRPAWYSLKEGVKDGSGNILVSIWLLWTILLLYFVYVVVFTLMGRPEWVRNLPIGGSVSTMLFLSGSYAVLVPLNTSEEIPRPTLRGIVVGIAIGCMVAGALMTATFLKVLNLGS